MGISSNIMKPPLPNVTWHFGTWPYIKWHPPMIRQFTKSWPCYRSGTYYRLWLYFQIPGGCHRSLATGAARQQLEDAYFFGHLVLSHLGLACICSNIFSMPLWHKETNESWILNIETIYSWSLMFQDFLNFEHPSVPLFCFNTTNLEIRINYNWLQSYLHISVHKITTNIHSKWKVSLSKHVFHTHLYKFKWVRMQKR